MNIYTKKGDNEIWKIKKSTPVEYTISILKNGWMYRVCEQKTLLECLEKRVVETMMVLKCTSELRT